MKTPGTNQGTRCLCDITLTLCCPMLNCSHLWVMCLQPPDASYFSQNKGIRCPFNQCERLQPVGKPAAILSSFIQLWEHLQSAHQRRHRCSEGLPFTPITVALSVKAHDANTQWQRSCYTVKAISRLCVLLQPWPWSVLANLLEHVVDLKVTFETKWKTKEE